MITGNNCLSVLLCCDNAEASPGVNTDQTKPGAGEECLDFPGGIETGMGEEPPFSSLLEIFLVYLSPSFDECDDEESPCNEDSVEFPERRERILEETDDCHKEHG